MNGLDITTELRKNSAELAKSHALKIKPKIGTTASSVWYFAKSGLAMVKGIINETNQQIKANEERYSKKVAYEMNSPIIEERNRKIKAVKDAVKNNTNDKVDARKKQNADSRKMLIRDSSWKLLQQIQMLIGIDAEISADDWKSWGEVFAGHYNEERAYAALAKTKDIIIIPVSSPIDMDENLENLRAMANRAADHMDKLDDDILSLSFFTDNPDSPVQKLIETIDNDIGSIIPAEHMTVLKRLKEAQKTAFDRDNVTLSNEINRFINRNLDRLATPEEINESLYAEAEEYINKGMTAKSELH